MAHFVLDPRFHYVIVTMKSGKKYIMKDAQAEEFKAKGVTRRIMWNPTQRDILAAKDKGARAYEEPGSKTIGESFVEDISTGFGYSK